MKCYILVVRLGRGACDCAMRSGLVKRTLCCSVVAAVAQVAELVAPVEVLKHLAVAIAIPSVSRSLHTHLVPVLVLVLELVLELVPEALSQHSLALFLVPEEYHSEFYPLR